MNHHYPEDGRVVSNFIVAALKNQPLTLHGDGSQTRSFCYVLDLIEVICRMMEQTQLIGPVNIGNPGEFTIRELAELVLELTGSRSRLTFIPAREDDPRQRRPDITLAREQLNWEPQVALREGLRETIDYFDDLLRQEGL